MMRIASRLALEYNCGCLISGESLGQVASQTLGAMICTEAEARVPIFKPLIGLDKNEIVSIARKIDTFETSILPYEDCCTVFTPRHPKTNPKLDEIIEAEKAVDFETLEDEAYENIEFMKILPEVYI
jgi:thiamine biosynthesis protein ThiI